MKYEDGWLMRNKAQLIDFTRGLETHIYLEEAYMCFGGYEYSDDMGDTQ